LFDLIQSLPETLRYENQLIRAEGDYVIAYGRFSGNGRPSAWIAAMSSASRTARLAEHWTFLQDEATQPVGQRATDVRRSFSILAAAQPSPQRRLGFTARRPTATLAAHWCPLLGQRSLSLVDCLLTSRRSHSAHHPKNENNEQNGSKNAATDIHVTLREFIRLYWTPVGRRRRALPHLSQHRRNGRALTRMRATLSRLALWRKLHPPLSAGWLAGVSPMPCARGLSGSSAITSCMSQPR